VLLEARRRSTRIPWVVRERALRVLREALLRRGEVRLALVFGGFLVPGKPVRDIDVAVYTGYRVPEEEMYLYMDELGEYLEEALRVELGLEKAVDVVLLDYAPPALRAAILRGGRVLVNREPGARAILLLHALDDLRGLRPLRRFSR